MNEKLVHFKRALILCVMTMALSFAFLTQEEPVYAALPELQEVSEEDYYGKEVLSNMENAEGLIYAYEKIAKGIENAQSSITVYDGQNAISVEEIKLVFEIYINDYPQHFWVNNGYSYSYNSTTVIRILPKYNSAVNDLETAKAEFEKAMNEIVSGIDASMSEFERELLVHDRIAAKASYKTDAVNAHNAYGAIVEGQAVCEGYARAFQSALYKVGIQSHTVTGVANGGPHAWTLVRIDNQYYYADVTWNDQDTMIYHAYFNLPLSEMERDHVLDAYIELPECKSWDANYFTIFGGIIEEITVDEIAKYLNAELGASLYFKCDHSEFWTWYQDNIWEIAAKCGITSGFSYGRSSLGNESYVYFKYATREEIPVTSVTVSEETHKFENEGETFTLSATVAPSTAQNQTITYSSGNTDVAIVNKYTGLVTCVGEGTANIIATAEDNGLTDVCEVSYIKEPLSGTLQINGSTAAITKTVGSGIVLEATATGGSGEYTYKYAVFNEETGTWFVLQDFGRNSSYEVKLSSAGRKQFAVTVKDSTGATVSTNRISVTAKEPQTKLSGSLQVNGSTAAVTQTVGSSVTIKAVAAGGSGGYTYKFAVYNEDTGNWFVLKDFSSSSTYTTVLKVAGAKQFAVTIKDSTGATVSTNRIRVVAKEASAALKGTLQVNGSTEAMTKTVGSSITLHASATGGSGEYTYKFAVYNEETGNWFILQDFSENASYTSGLKVAGGKQFAVTIKDSTGKTVATNRIKVTVVKE